MIKSTLHVNEHQVSNSQNFTAHITERGLVNLKRSREKLKFLHQKSS